MSSYLAKVEMQTDQLIITKDNLNLINVINNPILMNHLEIIKFNLDEMIKISSNEEKRINSIK